MKPLLIGIAFFSLLAAGAACGGGDFLESTPLFVIGLIVALIIVFKKEQQ